MDSFELNKIAGAVLFTCLLTLGLSIVAEGIFHFPPPEQPGYAIAVAEEGAEDGAAEEEGPDLATLLASADPAEGEAATRACQTCHTFGQGEPAKVGPNLYNTVGAPVGHMDGFGYSDSFQELHAAGETWTYDMLDDFLADPRGAIQGTAMSFAGVRDPEDRVDIIAYLASITDSPPPLPEPAVEAPAEGEQAAAEGEAAEGEAATEGDEAGEAAPAEGEIVSAEEQAAAPGTADQEQAETEAPAEGEDASAQEEAAPPAEEEAAPAEGEAAPAEGEAAPAESEAAPVEGEAAPAEGETAPADEAAPAQEAPAEEGAAAEEAPAEGGGGELAAMFADADPAEGESAVRICSACHTFDEGGAARVGPNLHDVVGRTMGSVEGFSYSDAMTEAGSDGDTWTYAELDAFLEGPRQHLPGTIMMFAGVRSEEDRADIIAYLASISEGAPPLPGQ